MILLPKAQCNLRQRSVQYQLPSPDQIKLPLTFRYLPYRLLLLFRPPHLKSFRRPPNPFPSPGSPKAMCHESSNPFMLM
jgi:hypothetical protein